MQIFFNAFISLLTSCDVFKACIVFSFCLSSVSLCFKLFHFSLRSDNL